MGALIPAGIIDIFGGMKSKDAPIRIRHTTGGKSWYEYYGCDTIDAAFGGKESTDVASISFPASTAVVLQMMARAIVSTKINHVVPQFFKMTNLEEEHIGWTLWTGDAGHDFLFEPPDREPRGPRIYSWAPTINPEMDREQVIAELAVWIARLGRVGQYGADKIIRHHFRGEYGTAIVAKGWPETGFTSGYITDEGLSAVEESYGLEKWKVLES